MEPTLQMSAILTLTDLTEAISGHMVSGYTISAEGSVNNESNRYDGTGCVMLYM